MVTRGIAVGGQAESFLAFAPPKDRQICPLLLTFGKGKIDHQLQHTGPGYTGDISWKTFIQLRRPFRLECSS